MYRSDTAHSRCAASARTEHVEVGKAEAFTLIEAAIVLGVVGLIIGGIWVAANAVQQRMHVNVAANAITTMITGIHQKVPLATYATVAYNGTVGYTTLDRTVIALGLVPPNLVISPSNFQLMPGSNWGVQLIGPTVYAPNAILLFGSVRDSAAASTLFSMVTIRWKNELVRAGCTDSAISATPVLADLTNPSVVICPADADGSWIYFYFKPGNQ